MCNIVACNQVLAQIRNRKVPNKPRKINIDVWRSRRKEHIHRTGRPQIGHKVLLTNSSHRHWRTLRVTLKSSRGSHLHRKVLCRHNGRRVKRMWAKRKRTLGRFMSLMCILHRAIAGHRHTCRAVRCRLMYRLNNCRAKNNVWKSTRKNKNSLINSALFFYL